MNASCAFGVWHMFTALFTEDVGITLF